jgi:hypothetical protein
MKHVKQEEEKLSRTAPSHQPSPVAHMLKDVNPTIPGAKGKTPRLSASRAGRDVVSSRPDTGASVAPSTDRVRALQMQVQKMIADEHIRRKAFDAKLAQMEEEIKRIKAQEIKELEEQLNALKEE